MAIVRRSVVRRQSHLDPAFAGTTFEYIVLIDRPDQVLDLLGMRTELLGALVEIGICDRGKALLVDIVDDLDAKRLQLDFGGSFEIERHGRLLGADFLRRRRGPTLLLGRR